MMGLAAGGRNVLGATICTALGYGLIANCDFGLVVGGYNIAQDLNDPNRKEYLVIAGNGTDSRNRSNAATLDREGNLWVSGKMTAGDDPTSDMDVATKKYVDDAVARIENMLNSITIENGVLTFKRGVNE
jgi:sugar lactone lactonase YvrE